MEYCRDNETEATVVGDLGGYSFTYNGGWASNNNNPTNNVHNFTFNTIANFGQDNWDYKDVNTRISSIDDVYKMSGKAFNVDWRLLAAWSSCECGEKFDVRARPKNRDGHYASTAGGIWQFVDETWNTNAPKGCEEKYPNYGYRFNPYISEQAFNNLFAFNLTKFRNAVSKKDQIALAIQSHANGTIEGASWAETKGNKYNDKHKGYLREVLNRYHKYCTT